LRGLVEDLHAAGKTVLCSTHEFKYVEGLFDTALVLSAEHRVARIGPYAEVVGDLAFLRAQNVL
jgi:cobalt/nickel transport system ATP-binding protein